MFVAKAVLPIAGRPVPCRLCESDFNSISELRQHLRESHFVGDPSDPITPERAEEEYRKRIFYLQEIFGPFEQKGEEWRVQISRFSEHQTRSYRGSRSLGFGRKLKSDQKTSRRQGACTIFLCASSEVPCGSCVSLLLP